MSSVGAPIELASGRPHVHLQLRRYGESAAKPVLLLHGASANYLTYLTGARSDASEEFGGLAPFLARTGGFDPWMLDWRGSSLVTTDDKNASTLEHNGHVYN